MEYKVITGWDGKEYAQFRDEESLDSYCLRHQITPMYYCVGGHMNGILLDDVVAETAQRNG